MDTDDKKLLMHLLIQELGVLARIDYNSDLNIEPSTFFSSSKKKKIDERRLNALDMSKKISHSCQIVLEFLNDSKTKEEAMDALLDVLKTDFDHPYNVSSCWNLNYMYSILKDGRQPLGT